jgi:hypothetical protein
MHLGMELGAHIPDSLQGSDVGKNRNDRQANINQAGKPITQNQ